MDRELDKSRHRMKTEKATGFRTDRKKIKNIDSELVKVDRKFKKQLGKGQAGKKLKMGTENWIKLDRKKILKAKALRKDKRKT